MLGRTLDARACTNIVLYLDTLFRLEGRITTEIFRLKIIRFLFSESNKQKAGWYMDQPEFDLVEEQHYPGH